MGMQVPSFVNRNSYKCLLPEIHSNLSISFKHIFGLENKEIGVSPNSTSIQEFRKFRES